MRAHTIATWLLVIFRTNRNAEPITTHQPHRPFQALEISKKPGKASRIYHIVRELRQRIIKLVALVLCPLHGRNAGTIQSFCPPITKGTLNR